MTEPDTNTQTHPAPWQAILENLAKETRYSSDAWGNAFVWHTLEKSTDLTIAAACLAENEARLCTVTAQVRSLYSDSSIVLSYHFDIHGTTVTVQTPLGKDGTDSDKNNAIPTITPWFRNADWNERECAELYDLRVLGRGPMERLFLDPDIDEGILNEVIPLTIMMNGACTRDMWEKIMSTNKATVPDSTFPSVPDSIFPTVPDSTLLSAPDSTLLSAPSQETKA